MGEEFVKFSVITILAVVVMTVTSCSVVPDGSAAAVQSAGIEEENILPEDAAEQEEKEDVFSAAIPFHRGIWEDRSYGRMNAYYEFTDFSSGRRLHIDQCDPVPFTYEIVGENQIVFHEDESDISAHYRFGNSVKHLIITFQEMQMELFWISNGTLEDIGGLGLTVSAKDVSPTGCTLVFTQEGGYPTGEIVAGNQYQMLCYDKKEDSWGWREDLIFNKDSITVAEDSTEFMVLDWTEEYGSLEPGRYILGIRVRDVRDTGGDWDAYTYRVDLYVPEEGSQLIDSLFMQYYKLPDGMWECNGIKYRYRLEISGRMPNAKCDSTFVYLSNLEDISFDRAWKAAGLSSNLDDYFLKEEAVLVDLFSN